MTTQVVLICVEDVLAAGQDLRSAAPQKWAKPLYEAIRSQYRTVALTRETQALARSWFTREGFGGWSSVLAWNGVTTYEDWRIAQVREFLANGWEIGFLLDAHPAVIGAASELGVLALELFQPRHWPGWKADDTAFRPWDEASGTVEISP